MKTKSVIIKIIFIFAAIFCLASCAAKSNVVEYVVGDAAQTGQSIPFAPEETVLEETVSEEKALEEKALEDQDMEEKAFEEIISEEKSSEKMALEEKPAEKKISEEIKPSEPPKEQEFSPKPSSEPLAEPEPASKAVKISIYGIDSFILTETEISFEEGQTAFDILKKVTREQEIPLDFNGRASRVYISGIDNIYEFDDGPESGWIYYVNGSYPNKSCGAYELNEGDVIEWKYTDKLVKDIF